MATNRAAPGTASPRLFGVRAGARHARPIAFPRALGVAGLATATTVALLPATSASAEPSAGQLELRVQQLDTQAAEAAEEFRQAEQRVDEVRRRADAAAEQAAALQARLAQARAQMSDVVAAAYRRGGNQQLAALVSDGDPQAFLDRASALDRIARSQADVVAEIETARSRAGAQQAAAERELQALREAHDQLERRRQQVERALQAQQDLLDGLQAQQVEAARAAAAAPARASRSGRTAGPAPAPAATPTYTGPASGRAKAAIDEGYRQLGKPYRYGGNGPDSFDCSGFTSWVWRAAGVSLPRTSRDQYARGRKVARADLQPGDLIYFGSPIHHVGMYLGDGRMIHAPSSGKTVHIAPAFRSDYVGATRP